jgi:hypothetical protein
MAFNRSARRCRPSGMPLNRLCWRVNLAPRAGPAQPQHFNDLDSQTSVTAPFDTQSVSRALTNRQPQPRAGALGSEVPAIAPRAPSEAEKRAIAEASKQMEQRGARVAIQIRQPENGPIEVSPTHSDGAGWQTRLQDALGTSSKRFVDIELARLMTVFRDSAGVIDARAVNAALAAIDGLKPQNEIEAMLAVQIAVTHALTMKFSARLYSGKIETIPQQDSAALTLSRLYRAFTTQVDTLSNMRRGGRQKVVVEHVHVYPGGQAIVGSVTHTGRRVQDKNEGQAHATDDQRTIAPTESAPMRSADPPRETLPVADSER